MPSSPPGRVRGVTSSLLASALFGTMFFVSGVIDASPQFVFGWRMILTLSCYAAALAWRPARTAARRFVGTLRRRRWMPLVLLATAAMVGYQMWLFAWTPFHGYGLDASLGYLLLPIALVVIGRLVFAERISPLQWTAVALAVIAVSADIIVTAAVSWVTFSIFIGYAAYFTARRRFGLDGPAVYAGEVVLLMPVSIVFVTTWHGASTAGGQIAVIAYGLAGAVAMFLYLQASRMLPISLFGLLSYVEPVLLFVAALVLGETLTVFGAAVYVLLAVALALLAVDGFGGAGRAGGARDAGAPTASDS